MLVLLNKPFGVLSQFSGTERHATLAPYISEPEVYAAGRLDKDSEGLLLLTDDGRLQQRISNPRNKWPKTYCVQVEGVISDEAIRQLAGGVSLKDGPTLPAQAQRIAEPTWLWPRNPPVRFRLSVPTSWVQLTITEGRNRQVRRMTAAVGFPTLRLIRVAVGPFGLETLMPGESRVETVPEQLRSQSASPRLSPAADRPSKPPPRDPHKGPRKGPLKGARKVSQNGPGKGSGMGSGKGPGKEPGKGSGKGSGKGAQKGSANGPRPGVRPTRQSGR